MTPNERKPHSRILIPLVVAALGLALGAGGIALLNPLDQLEATRLAATSAGGAAQGLSKPLSQAAVRARVEPSVVDVTADLTYDDETASGTGFVVDSADGLILTNNHVIRDATAVTVTVPSTGESYPARIVGVDVPADIAILQISPAARLPGAPLGDAAGLTPGAPVISFGNLAGAGGTPTVAAGVISGTNRTIEANDGASGFSEVLHGMLATTARIAPGDSGGPLASSSGAVIGVDTAAGTGNADTGYAIPITAALAAERQITGGHAGNGITLGTAGFLGIVVSSGSSRSPAAQRAQARSGATQTAAYVSASSTVAASAAVSPPSCVATADAARPPGAIASVHAGALVTGVLCGTGAAAAGIAAGDVITAAHGQPVVSARGLTALLNKCEPGTVISVTWVVPGGRSRTAPIRLTSAPAV